MATKERSVPKPQFTDAEAGALEFPSSNSRQFNYFEPARRRATMYEDVTVDVQPDPGRYLSQGWVYAFADGPGGYPAEWTEMKSSDWHEFRDPNQEWERTIYQNNANVVRQIQQNLENAKQNKAYALWNNTWAKVAEQHVSAWAHVEQGLGMHVFLPAQRDAPSNMINNAISVNSMHKLRFAQDIALYNLELTEQIDGFDGSAHIKVWKEDPTWQGVRENVELITTIKDWAEAVFVANVVFEPLIGELFRSEFVMQVAAPNGDFVTPTLMGAGENDYERDLRYTRVLYQLFSNDPEHGDANKQLMERWLGEWVPKTIDAARQMQPIWSQPQEKPVRFEDSLDRAKDRMRTILGDLEINAPEGLDQ
jgi:propane 2-monooxygenase small subunit